MNKYIKEKIQNYLDKYFELSLNDDDENRQMLGDAVDLLQNIKDTLKNE